MPMFVVLFGHQYPDVFHQHNFFTPLQLNKNDPWGKIYHSLQFLDFTMQTDVFYWFCRVLKSFFDVSDSSYKTGSDKIQNTTPLAINVLKKSKKTNCLFIFMHIKCWTKSSSSVWWSLYGYSWAELCCCSCLKIIKTFGQQ